MNRITTYIFFSIVINISCLIKAQDYDSSKIKTYMNQSYTYFSEKDYEKCREYSLKVLEIDSTFGDAYLLIGSAYINSAKSCGKDNFSEHVVCCLAVDKFQKAMEVDKSVVEKATKLIDVYSKNFPSKEAMFINPKVGQEYKVECWINETTVVRFSD